MEAKMQEKTPFTSSFIDIDPLILTNVESKVEGGFARIAQKIEVATSPLVMDFIHIIGSDHMIIESGSKVILMGDSGLQSWNKAVLEYNGIKFVMCPISQVLGFVG